MTPPNVQFIPASAALSLTIHDAFGGTGGLSGRTPDIVDNGNTWAIESGAAHTVTSGYCYATAAPTLPVFIDCGSTTYNIEMVARCSTATRTRHGVVVHYTDSNNYAYFYVEVEVLTLVERIGGSTTNTVISTGVALTANTEYVWTVAVTGSGYSVSLEHAALGTPSYGPFTGTFSVSSASSVGMNWQLTGSDQYITDYKVYT